MHIPSLRSKSLSHAILPHAPHVFEASFPQMWHIPRDFLISISVHSNSATSLSSSLAFVIERGLRPLFFAYLHWYLM